MVMRITVFEAKQRTRNKIAFEDVEGIIKKLATSNGYKPSITSRNVLQLTDKNSTVKIPLESLGFKDSSGGKLVADKSSASVLTKLAKLLKAGNYGENAMTLAKKCVSAADGLR